tara:strand:- start:583 stop:951 length:369 start_codon:yes stop_codon:yes gene_type:complete
MTQSLQMVAPKMGPTEELTRTVRDILADKFRDLPHLIIHAHRTGAKVNLVDMGEDKLNRVYEVLKKHDIEPNFENLNKYQKPWPKYRFDNRITKKREHWRFEFEWQPFNQAARLMISLTQKN